MYLEANSLETLTAFVKAIDDNEVALEEILNLYEEASEIDSKVYGNNHPRYALRISRVGAAYVDMAVSSGRAGLLEKAETLHLEALGIIEDTVERQELQEDALIIYLHDLSRTLLASGKSSEAKKHLERCLEIAEKYLVSASPALVTIFEFLGYALVYDRIGKWAAVKYFGKARKIAEALGMRERFLITTFNLATSLAISGREFEAENYRQQVIRQVSLEQIVQYTERFHSFTKGIPPNDLMKAAREALKEIVEIRKREEL